jgi:hypothetical protein
MRRKNLQWIGLVVLAIVVLLATLITSLPLMSPGGLSILPVTARPAMLLATQAPATAPRSPADTTGQGTGGGGGDGPNANGNPAQSAGSQRIVLKNATLSITVDDPVKSVAQITQLTEGIGGWVVTSDATTNERNGQQLTFATMSIRVPADKFNSVLEQIKASAIAINAETITGDDITAEFVDLSSQLGNLQATEAQLQQIMKTATKVDDVLQVQRELTDVQGQIEQIKGRLKYFSEAAAFSLINLTLSPKEIPATATPTPTVTPTPTPRPLGLNNWNPDSVAQSAANTLVGFGQIMISLVIWLLVFGLPVGILLAIVVFIVRRVVPIRPTLPMQTVPPTQESEAGDGN